MLTWELIGAVVGAGLASGREIASFFSQYGNWSYLGILLAAATMTVLSGTVVPDRWKDGWREQLWKMLMSLLLIATGGAMLSGAGEIAALTLPAVGARWFGQAFTFCLAWFLANRTTDGLAWISRLLMAVLAFLIMLGFLTPEMQAVHLQDASVSKAMLRGISYGGFNAALQIPIIEKAVKNHQAVLRRSSAGAGCIIMLLLLVGNAVLLRHPALLSSEMPFVRMAAQFGVWGYFLGAICLYLAILSTLTACLRGLGENVLAAILIVLLSLLGFTGVVELVYPLLGAACFIMMIAAKLTNYFPRTFHSRANML